MKRVAAMFMALGSAGALYGQTGAVTIAVLEPWRTVFADRDVTVHVAVVTFPATPAQDARVGWRLAAEGRTVQRSEQGLALTPGAPAVAALALHIPPLHAGLNLPLDLEIGVTGAADAAALASTNVTLQAFAKDPFADRAEWLRTLKLTLFDPEAHTAERFTTSSIPFTAVDKVDALEEVHEGTLVVGEGVSFADYRGLWGVLVHRAAAGVRVLVLAPAAGGVVLPGTADSELPAPRAVAWRHADVIQELDKRLDSLAAHTFTVQGGRGPVRAEFQDDAAGWPWLECRFAGGGRVVVCGLRVIEAWEASPTPRYFLSCVLEHLQDNNDSQRGKQDDH